MCTLTRLGRVNLGLASLGVGLSLHILKGHLSVVLVMRLDLPELCADRSRRIIIYDVIFCAKDLFLFHQVYVWPGVNAVHATPVVFGHCSSSPFLGPDKLAPANMVVATTISAEVLLLHVMRDPFANTL